MAGERVLNSGRAAEDRRLFQRFAHQHDPVERDVLIERFLPLARSLAQRYVQRGEPFEDVFQVACLGLVKAIDRYDVTRGGAFSSFAVPTITGEIKRYYRDHTWRMHVPRDLKELALAVDRVGEALELELSRSPTARELAHRLNMDEDDVLDALQARHARHLTSLDAPVAADEDDGDTVADRVPTLVEEYELVEDRADLRGLSRVLTPRERLVLRLRFEKQLTQREIGERIGVSQMQVSRIIRSSLARMQQYFEDAQRHAAESAPRLTA